MILKIGTIINWRTPLIFCMVLPMKMVMGAFLESMAEKVAQGFFLDVISWTFGIDFLKIWESERSAWWVCPKSMGWSFGCFVPSPKAIHGMVCEVLKLLNALLPTLARDQDVQMVLDKESFLANQPNPLRRFGNNMLPILMQLVLVTLHWLRVGTASGYISPCDRIVIFGYLRRSPSIYLLLITWWGSGMGIWALGQDRTLLIGLQKFTPISILDLCVHTWL